MDAWCIGKYINEQTSKEPYQHEVRPTQGSAKQKQKAHSKSVETKSVRISFRISDHDKETRHSQAKKFLDQGNKVKIDVVLKGREKAYVNQAKGTMEDFAKSLGDDIHIEQPFAKQGGRLSLTVAKK